MGFGVIPHHENPLKTRQDNMRSFLRSAALAVSSLLMATACNGNTKTGTTENQAESNMKKGKILVVYFSHAGENYSVGNIKVGNTKLVADEIARVTGADTFEIVAEKSYDMPYSALIKLAREETRQGELPAFKGSVENIEQYDTAFIGGPIWVMFTFFKSYDLNGKTIIPFTTHEGSGLANTVEDLKKSYPSAKVVNAFSIYGHEAQSDLSKVDEWLDKQGYTK